MKARVIAYYLPQFHPIPENDKYWGAGFTEWTNVAKAKPLFRGHYQPRIPADLGFYDLRLPEVREQQARLARENGIEGFCYWHYWFGNGKQLLQRPFKEVLASGRPDFPFCLAWANHNWSTKMWQRAGGKINSGTMIAEQLYPGEEDYRRHFFSVLPAFKDHRYVKVDGKPLFVIYNPYMFKDVSFFMSLWRELAVHNGLEQGIYFVAVSDLATRFVRQEDGTLRRANPDLHSSARAYKNILSLGFDGLNSFGKIRAEMIVSGKYNRVLQQILRKFLSRMPVLKYDYPKVMRHFFAPEDAWENVFPSIMPQWDRSPRVGTYDGVYMNATPKAFERHVMDALDVIKAKKDEHKILFLRSWNEWGEGNYVEPDLRFGHGFLDAIRHCVYDS